MCKSKWILALTLILGCFCYWRGLSQGTTYTIKNPYTADGNWYIGQLHFHTNNSDGSGTPAEMEAAYYDAGYDFVVTSDHRGTNPNYPNADDGLTADPDNSGSGKDLLWILGEELSAAAAHMNGISVNARNAEILNATPTWQTAIDEERTDLGIVQINHPRWTGTYTVQYYGELLTWKRYSLIEAVNDAEYYLDDTPSNPVDLADDFQQVWWTGADDAHNKTTDVDLWCVVVQTSSASIAESDIVASLDSGNFYVRQGPAATGINITGVTVSENTITVALEDIAATYTVRWYARGKLLAETDSNVNASASYTVIGTEGYIYVHITNDSTSKVAFTQPLFVGNSTDLSSSVAVSGGAGGDNIIDNNSGTYWDAGAGTGNFTIDAGATKQLNAIKIQWSSSGNATDRWNYKIETSPDDITYTEQGRTTYSNRASTTTDFFDVDARYVKVTVTSQSVGAGSNVRVLEAEVFNSSPASTNYYINNESGNDANDGLSTGAAWASFSATISQYLRSRDIVNFISTATPYVGGYEPLGFIGTHQYAPLTIQGDTTTRTSVDGTGKSYPFRIVSPENYVIIKNFDMYSSNGGYSSSAVSATIDNCIFRNQAAGTSSIYVSTATANLIVSNSSIHDNVVSTSGVYLGNAGGTVTITGSLIYSNSTSGIYAATGTLNVSRSSIYNNGAAGIESRAAGSIVYNLLYGNVGYQSTSTANAGTYNIYNNSVYSTGTVVGILIGNTTGLIANVKNNIISTSGTGYALQDNGTNNTINDSNNVVYGTNKYSGTWAKTNNVELDPLFVTAGSDFHLQATSPAKDAGVELGYTSDYDGKPVPKGAAPDIGAYEIQGGNRMLLMNVELRGRERGMRR